MLRNFRADVMGSAVSLFRHQPAARSKRAQEGRLLLERLEPRVMLDAGPLVISELMALNETTLQDEDGAYSDWIEIHNPTDEAINLDGWYLTDNAADLRRWRFPPRSLGPNEYLVVFASNKDRAARLEYRSILSTTSE